MKDFKTKIVMNEWECKKIFLVFIVSKLKKIYRFFSCNSLQWKSKKLIHGDSMKVFQIFFLIFLKYSHFVKNSDFWNNSIWLLLEELFKEYFQWCVVSSKIRIPPLIIIVIYRISMIKKAISEGFSFFHIKENEKKTLISSKFIFPNQVE